MSSLAERLKAETRQAHIAAERSRFMGMLLRGRLDRASYCALLRNLQAIYAALEPELLCHAQHPLIAPTFLPALSRSQALADDLQALHGDSWDLEIAIQPAAEAYVGRLHLLGRTQPALLFAHAYVRYLGDLSGGQMLRRIVAASLALAPGKGTAFYDFGNVDETRALIQAFRNGIDEMAVDTASASAVVAEALHAFHMHQKLVDALAQACGLGGNEPVPPHAMVSESRGAL